MALVKIIDSEQVKSILEGNYQLAMEAAKIAFSLHQKRLVRAPNKVYLQASDNAHTADRIIALPAYVNDGELELVGMKWIGSNHANFESGLPRAHALINLNNPKTNAPEYVVDGTMISAYRTLATSLIAIERLAPKDLSKVAILGMGNLGHLHAVALKDVFTSIEIIKTFSRAPNRPKLGDHVVSVVSVKEAVEGAQVIVNVTATNKPYLSLEGLDENVLIVNLSLMDCVPSVFSPPTIVIVDDVEQSVVAKKVFREALEEGIFNIDKILELSAVLADPTLEFQGKVKLVNPLGMAVQDLVLAKLVIDRLDLSQSQTFTIGG